MGSLYVSKYFKEDSKSAALEMVADIRAKFSDILNVSIFFSTLNFPTFSGQK